MLDSLYRQLEAHNSLLHLVQPRLPLPPLRGWSMSPDSLLIVATLVKQSRCRAVVELGSGASTIVLGYMLARQRGRLVTVEHDRRFAASTNRLVRLHRLEKTVAVLHAPLKPVARRAKRRWYDPQLLDDLPASIDLLLVDGPPGELGPAMREPAGKFLFPRLARRGVVCLDDASRAWERKTAERWRTKFNMSLALEATEKGLALLRPANGSGAGGDRDGG